MRRAILFGGTRRSLPTRNVQVTEHFDQFIDASVESGRFSDASALERRNVRRHL